MTQQHHRENSMLFGVGILLAAVTVVFFGFTLALQQQSRQAVRLRSLRKQLKQVHEQIQPKPLDPEDQKRQGQASLLAGSFVSGSTDGPQEYLAAAATQAGIKISFLPGLPPEEPQRCLPGFKGCYEEIPLVATLEGRYQNIADFLKRISHLSAPLVSLSSAVLSPLGDAKGPVQLKARAVLKTYRWIPGALPRKDVPPAPAAAPEAVGATEKPGMIRDPFDSRWIGSPVAKGMTLGGVLWDPEKPSCILNGEVVQVGAVVGGYTVAAIEPAVVLLRGDGELVLTVS
ncbi:MAG: type 4a pilus biogenesis protein PilO [Candidatus Omnitrophica bacterium]|nr:type 4a pilus biogenesis protein PilO [Candidatus Omnitrophota bacterium]